MGEKGTAVVAGSISRGTEVGIVAASAVVPMTFTRSLSERTWLDQGLITGLATGAHFVLTVVAQDAVDIVGEAAATTLPFPSSWSDEQRRRAAIVLTDMAIVPLGFGVVAIIGYRDNESNVRALIRQAGWRFAVTGTLASLLSAGQASLGLLDRAVHADGRIQRLPIGIPIGLATSLAVERWRQRDTPPDQIADPARANPLLGLAAGAGVVATLGGLAYAESWMSRQLATVAGRVLPGSEATWRRAMHGVTLLGLAYGTHALWNVAMHRIEAGTTSYEEGMDDSASGVWTNPMVSGDPASLVSWEGLGREGRRHVITYVRPEITPEMARDFQGHELKDLSISTVMQEPAKATPIAVFVGLDNAPTARERVDLALAEMDRTDAWSRSLIMLISPTGTGYVNYVATAVAQYLTLGDVATVTLQYSKRPSPLSLGKTKGAKEQNRLLWLRILERVRSMPVEDRPKVVVFGESLGALTSQNPFVDWGTVGPEALGIDRGLWIGTPAGSTWRQELLGPDRPDVDRSAFAVVNDYEQFRELPEEERAKVRYVLLSHDNDGVTKFDAGLITHRPDWLGDRRPRMEEVPGRSPRGVPASMRWRPMTTFFQLLVDMKNAQIPGAYRAWAHDYRPDLPEFIRDVYGLTCTPEQMTRIKQACQEREEIRESVFT
ncbi:MAG: hypothetical protein GC156_15185 [Actinomycetales bacterium]|nr:hypothetical protein [Actinomycetales bacterium]